MEDDASYLLSLPRINATDRLPTGGDQRHRSADAKSYARSSNPLELVEVGDAAIDDLPKGAFYVGAGRYNVNAVHELPLGLPGFAGKVDAERDLEVQSSCVL